MRKPHAFVAAALLAASTAAMAADIVLTPPAAGGVSVTNAAGNATRFRVGDDGAITLPSLAPAPGTFTGLCLEIATGRVGTCVVGGAANAFVTGGNAFGAQAFLGTTDAQPLVIGVKNAAAIRLTPTSGTAHIAAGSPSNVASGIGGGEGAVVAGGGSASYPNVAASSFVFVGGGLGNTAGTGGGLSGAAYAVAVGGNLNSAGGTASAVVGGLSNSASSPQSFIGAGSGNMAQGFAAVVGGGISNSAGGFAAVIGGGDTNASSGNYSMVPGGSYNQALGDYSFAAGFGAKTATQTNVPHAGAFVWSDSQPFNFHSSAPNEFAARATGGVRFVTAVDGAGAPTVQATIDTTGTVNAGGLRLSANGTKIARLQAGETVVGAGGNGVNIYTITFPSAFTGVPRVVVSPKVGLAGGAEVNDTLVATIRVVSATQFKVNVYRVDVAGGLWSAPLALEWMAWE